MKQKTVVDIYDMEFTFVGEESEEYVRKIAALVDRKIREVTENSKCSTLAAAILSAANIADDYYKALDAAEELKGQLRGYFEEISRLKDENDSLRRAARPSGAGRRRRNILEEIAAAEAPAETPAPAEEPAELPVEPEMPAEPETSVESEGEPEEFAPVPEVTLVMDSEIAAVENAVQSIAPEEMEEGEQLKFEK